MKKQDTYRNLLIASSVVFLFYVVGEKIIPRPALPPPGSENVSPQSTEPGPQTAAQPVSNENVSDPKATPGNGPANPSAWSAVEAAEEQIISLGALEGDGAVKRAPEPPFRTRLLLSNVGASVDSALLTDYAQQVGKPDRYQLLSPVGDPSRGRTRSFSIEKINIDDVDVVLHTKKWSVVGPPGGQEIEHAAWGTGQQVVFALDLAKNDVPAVRLSRSFQLPRQDRAGGRHDLFTELVVQNLSAEPHRIVVTQRGGVGIPASREGADDRVFDVGGRGQDGIVLGRRHSLGEIHKGAGRLPLFSLTEADLSTKFSWAACGNTYFTCTIAPLSYAGSDVAEYLTEVSGQDLDGVAFSTQDVTLRFVSRGETFAPGQSLTFRNDVYLGEKDSAAFKTVETYKQRNYHFQISAGFGWCTFSFLVEFMIWLFNGIHAIVPNYGVAIIVFVLVIRAMLHPITKKGQVNMVRMQKQIGDLGPKLEEMKRRFANDKVRLQQETMKLYREGGISPASQMLTCLPMLIQLPIWAALWLSLNNNVQMRHEAFCGWIRDLTAPDALYTFAAPVVIPIFGWHVASFNLLPFLMAGSMYLQQKLQPKPKPNPNWTPEQRQQQEMMQKMMPMMNIMMLIMLYNSPSGLTLYITFSSIFGAIEQWWIRKHIAAHEAAGTLVRVVARPMAPTDAASGQDRTPSGWFQKLQKKLEDAQKIQRSQRAKPRR